MSTRTSAFRRYLYTDPDLRVSDAERSEVADRLAGHYADGRLTQEEFNERVDRAMNAKTQSDLAGLFADLPNLEGAEAPAVRVRGHARHRPLLVLALVAALLIAAGHGLWWFFMPHWLSVLLLVAVIMCAIRAVDHRRCRRDNPPAAERRP